MSLARFTFTNRARPIIELGVGDNRIDTAGGRWQVSYWDNPTAIWAGTEPLWLDITCITYDVTTTLGRQRTTDNFAPGTASLTMSNVAGWADPNPPAGTPAFEQIRPGCPLRIGVDHDEYGIVWLWRGYVDAVEPEFQPQLGDVANISAVCALGEAGRVWTAELPELVGDGDTASMRFNRILNAAEWPAGARSIEAVATPMLPTVFGEQTANMLTQCADSYGGAVYGDTEGCVVARNRDWQTYMPDTPPDATVGNFGGTGSPGYWAPGTPAVPGYLTPTVGTVTTPDPGPLPAECVFVYKMRLDTDLDNHSVVVSQDSPGQRSWSLFKWYAATTWVWSQSSDGTAEDIQAASGVLLTGGTDQTWALAVDQDAAGSRSFEAFSYDGSTWTSYGAFNAPLLSVFDSTALVRIGANYSGTANVWQGRIYSVELRTGLDPAAGTVLWRFDADDYPGTGTSYVDPRGRTWTLTNAAAITPKVPEGPPVWVPSVLGEVCPSAWHIAHDRADIITRVILAQFGSTEQRVYDDVPGQLMYGIETYETADLICALPAELDLLAARLFRTRGYQTGSRVDRLVINAATGHDAVDLVTTASVFKPSRWRCRHMQARGTIFDAELFVTGIRHEISPTAWITSFDLDAAAPWVASATLGWSGGTWDRELWADDVAVLLDEARQLLAEMRAA